MFRMKQLPNLGLGLCIPATCSPQVLVEILDPILYNLHFKMADSFDTTQGCQTDDPIPFKGVDYFAMLVILYFLKHISDFFHLNL